MSLNAGYISVMKLTLQVYYKDAKVDENKNCAKLNESKLITLKC